MEVKSLGTLKTRRLKLTPSLLHPKAMLYFVHPVHFTLSLKSGGEGRAIRDIRTIAKVDLWPHLHI